MEEEGKRGREAREEGRNIARRKERNGPIKLSAKKKKETWKHVPKFNSQ